MNDPALSLPGADPASPIHTSAYGVSALLAGQITAYFSTLQAAELVEVYRRMMKELGAHLRWFRTETSRRSRAIRDDDLEAFPSWFSSPGRLRSEYELVMESGPTAPGEVGPWGLRFGVERDALPGVMGYLQCHVPAQGLERDPQAFASLARAIFEAYPWVCGQAGYAVAYDPGVLLPERNLAIKAFVMRYKGVDCTDVLTESELPHARIKGVNWLTHLGAELVQAMGSQIDTPPAAITLMPTARGACVMRAGPRPVLGDSNRRASESELGPYIAADSFLRELRVDNLFPLPGFADEEESWRWVHRFEKLGT